MKRSLAIDWRGGVLAILAGWAVSGCRHAPAVREEGLSSFRLVEPPAKRADAHGEGSSGPRQPVDVLVAAEPIAPMAKPAYPRAASGKHHAPVLVSVCVTVDENGRVADVEPNWRGFSTPGPLAADFLAAVRAALAQWRFTPAEKQHLVPGKGAPGRDDYWVITRVERTAYAIDIVFAFAASGDVMSDAK